MKSPVTTVSELIYFAHLFGGRVVNLYRVQKKGVNYPVVRFTSRYTYSDEDLRVLVQAFCKAISPDDIKNFTEVKRSNKSLTGSNFSEMDVRVYFMKCLPFMERRY